MAHRIQWVSAWLAGVLLAVGTAATAADDAGPALSDAEQMFVKQLSDRVMVGQFSVEGREDPSGKPERYTIGKVTKLQDDLWTIEARIQYGKVDATVPVPVHVHWAGDTPMVSVTDLNLPLVGNEFSARVLFHGDRYAGTWQHGQVGGHMWGRLEDAPAGAAESANP
ncbi:MAG: hypothetical protein KDA75_12940 [Planctomycetaceae bacterium]|nr:hypothetical protein [Planctomycetaceae bacterium]